MLPKAKKEQPHAAMRRPTFSLLSLAAPVTMSVLASVQLPNYPLAARDTATNRYGDTTVAAPYQWMEDSSDPALAQWVAAENKLTSSYLDKIPVRPWIQSRLAHLSTYERISIPERKADALFFMHNAGADNQSSIYTRVDTDAAPRLVLDPNSLSHGGYVALTDWEPSWNARYLAYALSPGGTDWEEIKIRDVWTGRDFPEELKWVKFSEISWTKDSRGFFYSRYPEPPTSQALSAKLDTQSLYYHRIGTPQNTDRLVFSRADLPDWLVRGSVSDDGRYLFVTLVHGDATTNELFYAKLGDPQQPLERAELTPLFIKNDYEYTPISVDGDTLYLQTTRAASRRQIASISLSNPADSWHAVIPEAANVIETALRTGEVLAVQYSVDAHSEVKLFDLHGIPQGDLKLPGIGTVRGLSGNQGSNEMYYGYTSFLSPASVYRYNTRTGKTEAFFKPKLDFDPSPYETRQVFYRSKDGTRIPMFITARKDLKLDGSHPTVLYGYGGFNFSVTPSFSSAASMWLELGGIYAVANLRGGGEYGEAWHQAGMLDKKKNVFEDFEFAGKYLIEQGYTTSARLAIDGYSNGGLVVAVSVEQQPQLFGAAYAGGAPMDMLRFQKFSDGAQWIPELGSSDDPEAFQWLKAYSPLQNIEEGACYPPMLITTSDHDDRVVPSHSYKFTAALQRAQSCENPILLRVETQTSHSFMPADKRIAQQADIWSFMAHSLGIRTPPAQ